MILRDATLGLQIPQEPVSSRDNLFRPQVGPASSGGHEDQRGPVVLDSDGGSQRRSDVPVLDRPRDGQPTGQPVEQMIEGLAPDDGADSGWKVRVGGVADRQQAAPAGYPEDTAEQPRRVMRIGQHARQGLCPAHPVPPSVIPVCVPSVVDGFHPA